MFYKIDTVYITLVNIWYEILKVTGYLSSEALVQICSIQKGGRWNLGRVPQLVHRFHWNRRVRFSTVCTRLNSVTHTHCETSRNPRFKLQHLAVVMIRKMMSPPKKKWTKVGLRAAKWLIEDFPLWKPLSLQWKSITFQKTVISPNP